MRTPSPTPVTGSMSQLSQLKNRAIRTVLTYNTFSFVERCMDCRSKIQKAGGHSGLEGLFT